MPKYNRETAIDLAADLVEMAQIIVDSIKDDPPEGPLLDEACERLGAAISLLVPIIKP